MSHDLVVNFSVFFVDIHFSRYHLLICLSFPSLVTHKFKLSFCVLGRKTQYWENNCTTKCNLQIQCDPYQITNRIFHRTRTKNFTIHMETQKTPNSQSNLQKVKFLCMFLGSLFFFSVFLSFRKSIQSIMDLILDNI